MIQFKFKKVSIFLAITICTFFLFSRSSNYEMNKKRVFFQSLVNRNVVKKRQILLKCKEFVVSKGFKVS